MPLHAAHTCFRRYLHPCFPQLPRSLPQTSSGITLHWHGLYMWNDAAWYDGASYVTMCPIAPGTNFTYRFLVRAGSVMI